jgi:hypothetical protein
LADDVIIDDEFDGIEIKVEEQTLSTVSLDTKLNNRVIDLRTPTNQAI